MQLAPRTFAVIWSDPNENILGNPALNLFTLLFKQMHIILIQLSSPTKYLRNCDMDVQYPLFTLS